MKKFFKGLITLLGVFSIGGSYVLGHQMGIIRGTNRMKEAITERISGDLVLGLYLCSKTNKSISDEYNKGCATGLSVLYLDLEILKKESSSEILKYYYEKDFSTEFDGLPHSPPNPPPKLFPEKKPELNKFYNL